jgi:methyltransferase
VSAAEFNLVLVTLQRAGELVLSHYNTRRLLARGAVEVAPRHYPLMVAVHAVWLISLWMLGHDRPLHVIALMRTLGARWTTGTIVLPEHPLVSVGPYRCLSHPNYTVVAGEIAVLPLVLLPSGTPPYVCTTWAWKANDMYSWRVFRLSRTRDQVRRPSPIVRLADAKTKPIQKVPHQYLANVTGWAPLQSERASSQISDRPTKQILASRADRYA